ncbi:anthranilate phosphoribosyltransferase [Paenibacillus albicereus]|uniref:Anthranilate phosphoribosyltransferase n=2 Tax=Paenibacillus albicereus TaxID=2726185 RepID=A0A6H2H3Y8_9BACL|nr:anthranilate phosphoribosyltransferase [Paenibacillus albicereus]QJC54309.1 anthranilate phosphoribosyltransferase [Paenibacillus albicereus]
MEAIRTTTMQGALDKLIGGGHLTRAEAGDVMRLIMDGAATPAQIAGVATALRMKGETIDEISGFAETMRGFSRRVETVQEGLLDTCGTGGSGIHKFNISTASSIIAAASGVRVAKHGNRAMSGKAGSADVLEALGVSISLDERQAAACLQEIGICFMFAQLYHPSLRHAAAPRRELGVRTIFNMLGPLANPAGADRQLLGLYDRARTETVASVLHTLGLKRALVVSSHDGLDEISISAATTVSELGEDGQVRTYDLTPEEMGIRRQPLSAIQGGSPEDNAAIIRRIFAGTEDGAYRDIVLLNAGACIYTAGAALTLQGGVEAARHAVDSGAAGAKLEQLIQKTGELSHVS